MIGLIAARRVQAVKVGHSRTYRCEFGVIEHLSIRAQLYFGFSMINGNLVSSPEEALLAKVLDMFADKFDKRAILQGA